MTKSQAAFRFSVDRLFDEHANVYFWTVTFAALHADWECSRRWGKFLNHLRKIVGRGWGGLRVTELHAEVLTTDLCGPSPAERVAFTRTYIGPTKTIFDGLDAAAQDELAAELTACFARFNRATDGTLVATAEYLQTIATRRTG